jgi:hypothetical protein
MFNHVFIIEIKDIWGKQPRNHTRIILGVKYKTGYHTALNKQKPTYHDKLLMAPQIKHNWESIHPYPSLTGLKPTYCPKWVWIFSPYPPYTATWYNTPVSCSQIAMSPQNVLSVHSVSSASVVILIWRLYQNMASSNLQNKFIQNYGIGILKRKEKYRCETIHSFPL